MSENTKFDQDLRTVLRDMAPADVPASLRDAVAAVPRTLPVPAGSDDAANRRRFLAFAGIAAVVAVAAVGLALALGGRFNSNIAAPSPSFPAATGWVRLTYTFADLPGPSASAAASDGVTSGRTSLEVAKMRLDSRRIAYSAQAQADGFSIAVPDSAAAAVLRLMATGRLDIVPMGTEPPAVGATVDLAAHPALFSNDGIASAYVGTDQSGGRTIGFNLTATARGEFAAYTTGHVGEYFAIALDGRVLTAPAIQASIPNGQVEVSAGGAGGLDLETSSLLGAIVISGPMPRPLVQTSSEQVPPPAEPSTPEPSSDASPPAAVPTPAPSDVPSRAPMGSANPLGSTLALTKVSGLPGTIQQVTRWTGGYLAVVMDPDLMTTLWASTDGQSWQHAAAVEALLGGFVGAPVVQAARCGSGVLVMVNHSDGSTRIAWTTDLATGTFADFSGQAASSVVGLAGSANGAIAATEGGKVVVTTDCSSWGSAVLVSKATSLHLSGVAILRNRYVAVGYAGPAGSETPLAWWSDDGQAWTLAKVTAPGGMGFSSAPVVASGGAMAVLAAPGATGGISSFYGTRDGKSWAPAKSPLGKLQGDAGSGSDAGLLSGDGSRLLAAGSPGSHQSAPAQYWVGDGAGTWQQVTLDGSETDLVAINAGGLAFVVDNGLLFSGDGGTFLAAGTLP